MCAAIVCAGSIGARLLSNVPFFQILNLKAFDSQFALRGRVPTNDIALNDIVLLVADQKAMDTFTDLRVFWHPYYAQAIQAAGQAGARVIGLDLAFGVPVDKWEPDYDRMLAEAVSTSPVPVVCGYVPALNTNQETLPVPINMIAAALGLSGFANLTNDPDDFVRRQVLIEAPSSDPAGPPPARSLGMRVAEKFLGEDATFQNGRLMLQGRPIPIASDQSIFINYAGPPGTFTRVSLADFIAAARAGRKDQLHDWVNGKIVLLGTDFVDDRFDTPFYTSVFSGSRNTAGVEIHASTVRTILEGQYLRYLGESWRMAALLLASAVAVAFVMLLAAARASVALVLEVLGVLVLTQILFRGGLILSSSEMLLAAALSAVAAVVYRFATAETRGALFRQAISLFVGAQLSPRWKRPMPSLFPESGRRSPSCSPISGDLQRSRRKLPRNRDRKLWCNCSTNI